MDPEISLARVAENLNQAFPMNPETGQYFTLLYGALNTRSNELRAVSAGHPGPILVRPGEEPRALDVSGFPIGLIDRPDYEESRIQLRPGDRLYIHTATGWWSPSTRRRSSASSEC